MRSCDLAAIAIQDRVFIGDRHVDADYEARRRDAFFVAVNCAKAGGTCFCVSMDTGPKAESGLRPGADRAARAGGHRFLVEVGSERGARGAGRARRRGRASEADDAPRPRRSPRQCASQMGRELDTDGIKELLYANIEHPRWDEVAERCLTCGNCTLVCPTCFCSTVGGHDRPGRRRGRAHAAVGLLLHPRSLLHPRRQRPQLAPRARYRQWMTHKLASWIDQFGTSGCVGCGRCITWCPVAIDITEEAAAIRATDLAASPEDARGIADD